MAQFLYHTSSPVLFLIFNRPDLTAQVFEMIAKAQPSHLYVAADGPRKDKIGEWELCEETRKIVQNVDWPCEVKTLFRDENLGCKYAVSSAIDWFFENEEEGIILEDDILPSTDFFRFCDLMLDRYRYDTRIRHITGCNLQHGQKWGDTSYYFSNNIHVWGWAGWRRVWREYDVELSQYHETEIETQLRKVFTEDLLVESWVDIFLQLKRKEIDTWDYQVGFSNFFNNGLCVIPNYNLVSNLGFRPDGTHTFDSGNANSNIALEKLPENLVHPKYILPEKVADSRVWSADFNLPRRRAKQRKRKIKNFFKNFFKTQGPHSRK